MDNKIWRMQDEEADEISIITYSTVHMTQPKHNQEYHTDFFYNKTPMMLVSQTKFVLVAQRSLVIIYFHLIDYTIFLFNRAR